MPPRCPRMSSGTMFCLSLIAAKHPCSPRSANDGAAGDTTDDPVVAAELAYATSPGSGTRDTISWRLVWRSGANVLPRARPSGLHPTWRALPGESDALLVKLAPGRHGRRIRRRPEDLPTPLEAEARVPYPSTISIRCVSKGTGAPRSRCLCIVGSRRRRTHSGDQPKRSASTKLPGGVCSSSGLLSALVLVSMTVTRLRARPPKR